MALIVKYAYNLIIKMHNKFENLKQIDLKAQPTSIRQKSNTKQVKKRNKDKQPSEPSISLTMSNFSTPSSSQIKQKPATSTQLSSFSTLSNSTTGQYTKKSIQPEQLHAYQPHSISPNKYLFSLPYAVEISDIVSNMTILFNESIIHVEEDANGGKLILNGLKGNQWKRYFVNVLDCLLLPCVRYGLKGGALHQTHNIITISIKKQILNNQCLLTITHPSPTPSHFPSTILSPIQVLLQKLSSTHPIQQITQTKYLSADSVFHQQIQIKQILFNIFIYVREKKWERFRRLYWKSQEVVRERIGQFRKDRDRMEGRITKGNQVSNLVQQLVFQSQSLFRMLSNYYEKQAEDQHDLNLFSTLLSTPSQKQITLHSIQELLSSKFMQQIYSCYHSTCLTPCQTFNHNLSQLRQKFTTPQCFIHLQLKQKFRLPLLTHPYLPSINLLSNINSCSSFRSLLLLVQKVFSSVKIDCLKASNGKVELVSMDQLLPVMIFVTMRAGVRDFPVWVRMLDDYVRIKNVFQLEERIITTLHVAVEDISAAWKKN